MMINKEHMSGVADYLTDIVREAGDNFDLLLAKDWDINTWIEQRGLRFLCYEPAIFQHTGVFSSVTDRLPSKGAIEGEWYMTYKHFSSEGKAIAFDRSHWDTLTRD